MQPPTTMLLTQGRRNYVGENSEPTRMHIARQVVMDSLYPFLRSH